MKGKDLCETLKTIRKKIAEANGIPYEAHECTHEGDCLGTCPLCDCELQYLQEQIRLLEDEGKEVNLDVLTADEKELLFTNVHFNNSEDEEVFMGDIVAPEEEEYGDTVLMGEVMPPEHILAGIPALPDDDFFQDPDESKTKKKK